MNLRRLVLDSLEDAPRGLCDACLQKNLGASSHQHVNATCRNLESEGRLVREKKDFSECDSCSKVRVLNFLVPIGAQGSVSDPLAHHVSPTQKHLFGINQLDDLRREIIQTLNRLDPSSCKDGFSKRVVALRNNQAIPTTIASLMLTHAAYRNELYYNAYQLREHERVFLEGIDKHLRQYLASNHPNINNNEHLAHP